MLPLSIEVSVRRPGSNRLACVVANGCDYGNALTRAVLTVAYYTCDPEGPLYDYAEVLVVERCKVCSGNGRRLKPKRKHTYVPCDACGADGYLPVGAWSYSATAEERDAWRAWNDLAREGAGDAKRDVCRMLPTAGRARVCLDHEAYEERAALHRMRRESAARKAAGT
jgi:hypothetical protein